ncbi:MAG: DNA alkylation repair protein [Bacteroidales bacterium]|nr:DNA alkylation repair protein [Lentimicrobiaceae bacterium]MDD5693936.1 DNA alkylation repair protein [Bacteroidales bacterium]
MTHENLLKEIILYCQQHADADIVKKYSRYFKGGYQAYGLTSELLNGKVEEIINKPDLTLDLVIKTSRLLVTRPEYEMTSFAVLLIRNFKKEFKRSTFDVIQEWFETGIHNWAHCDVICGEIFPIFYSGSLITYQDLAHWKTAPNKFQRRAVPVSMIKLLKTQPRFTDFFRFIDSMMMDKDREVHQGLGWFLREAWKLNNADTEAFLMKWKDTAPRLIFQYATEKMTPEAKARFRKEKP